jgi:hypothetical protein
MTSLFLTFYPNLFSLIVATTITPVSQNRISVQARLIQLSIKPVADKTREWNIVKLASTINRSLISILNTEMDSL